MPHLVSAMIARICTRAQNGGDNDDARARGRERHAGRDGGHAHNLNGRKTVKIYRKPDTLGRND